MSHSKNYDNNKKKNNDQSKTNPVEDLNEILSVENASAERILSRIDHIPIQEVKQRLKQHLKETHIQRSRLKRIIRWLGGKPTYAKADLSLSFVSTTMPMGNNFPKTVKLNSMNIASKITSLTGANKISIGENVYKSLDHKTQREFHELSMPDNRWKYINYGTDRPYKVYTLNI
jgi:hypothetical protein